MRASDLIKPISHMRQLLTSSIAIARADFKLKNEGNYLGLLWYILDPLFLFAIFLVVRNFLGAGIEHYPVYLLIGLILFNFFQKVTGDSISAIPRNANLISNLKIKPEVFVFSAFLKSTYAHLFEMLIIIATLLYFNLPIWYLGFYILIFFVFSLFILGISLMLSSISVYINDLSNIWNVFTRLLWFTTPIFYSSRLELPFDFNRVNPMYHFITMTRDIVIHHQVPELWMILASIIEAAIVFMLGLFIFQRTKLSFAENL